MVKSRSVRTNGSAPSSTAPWLVRTVSAPSARFTVTTSPNEVGVASTIAAVCPATDIPATTRPAPVSTGRGWLPADTAYTCVQPRSRTQNQTVPSALCWGRAPG